MRKNNLFANKCKYADEKWRCRLGLNMQIYFKTDKESKISKEMETATFFNRSYKISYAFRKHCLILQALSIKVLQFIFNCELQIQPTPLAQTLALPTLESRIALKDMRYFPFIFCALEAWDLIDSNRVCTLLYFLAYAYYIFAQKILSARTSMQKPIHQSISVVPTAILIFIERHTWLCTFGLVT